MTTADDERLLRQLNAPDVEQALDSLGYWLARHRALPVYRRSARAEARRMIVVWQQRALADAPRAPLATAASAGAALRVGRQMLGYHADRLRRRVAVGGLAVLALALLLGLR